MKMCHVPECFIKIMRASLTGRTTCLKFNNFLSGPFLLDNSTTQGDPFSMLYYSFYNAPLISTAVSDDKLSPGFIDDSMMLATGNSLRQCHEKLKEMMERLGGGFEWSYTHNSPFELSRTTLMNFPRSHSDLEPGNLTLDKPNPDSTITFANIVLQVLRCHL